MRSILTECIFRTEMSGEKTRFRPPYTVCVCDRDREKEEDAPIFGRRVEPDR